MNKKTLTVLFLVVFIMIAEFAISQTPPARRPPPPPGLPIDGGLLALISVAFGYAVKKLRIKK